MATNYPGGLDTYVALADNVDDVLAAHTNDRGDAVEQLEIKLGVDTSAVNTTIDYFLKHASGAYRGHRHDGGMDDGAASIGPLTGLSLANNVDMGNYQVRAKQFYADVATGTAPFVVSSTSQVANLNVDRVDNLHLPGSVASILTDHNKATHDALAIDAANSDTLDGYHYNSTRIKPFGSWGTRGDGVVNLAATDGLVVVTLTISANHGMSHSLGYTDGSNPPTTIRGSCVVRYTAAAGFEHQYSSFCMPVKRGDRYRVVKSNDVGDHATQIIYWIPAGA